MLLVVSNVFSPTDISLPSCLCYQKLGHGSIHKSSTPGLNRAVRYITGSNPGLYLILSSVTFILCALFIVCQYSHRPLVHRDGHNKVNNNSYRLQQNNYKKTKSKYNKTIHKALLLKRIQDIQPPNLTIFQQLFGFKAELGTLYGFLGQICRFKTRQLRVLYL